MLPVRCLMLTTLQTTSSIRRKKGYSRSNRILRSTPSFLTMPEMTGVQLALAAEARNRGIKIVLTSVYTPPGLPAERGRLYLFTPKPYCIKAVMDFSASTLPKVAPSVLALKRLLSDECSAMFGKRSVDRRVNPGPKTTPANRT